MQLLPDLTPWASQSHGFMYDWVIQGNDLRLTSAIANIGSGELEIRGGAIQGGTQDVFQRIYDSDGTSTDVLAGTFIHHPEHDHLHFEEFAEFRLRAVTAGGGVGDVVADGSKVSFCLLDVERYGTPGPATPQFLSCGPVQGISAGWADVYHRGLPGQSIDITGVPDGEYWLEVVADPTNRIIEANETNNVTRIRILLERPPGNDPIPPDTFEHNDSLATASILAPPELHTYANLSIHASLNDDYFRVTASQTGILAFDLAFKDARGDLDLEVFDSSGARVSQSATASDREHIVVEATAGETYFVRVFGFEGATNPNYSLIVDPGYAAPSSPGRFTEEGDSVRLSSAGRFWHALGGEDEVTGTASRDVVFGDGGDDTLLAGAGHDDLYGGYGADRLQGGAGNDWIDGGAGKDAALYGDAVYGVSVDLAASAASGGAGRDTLVGIENVGGSRFADRLSGNGLSNVLLGEEGGDRLTGLGGDDFLYGGTGRDTLLGGAGGDWFVFRSVTEAGLATGADIIGDFQHGTDTIDLGRVDASSALGGNSAFLWRGTGNFGTSLAGELRIERHNSSGTANDYTIVYGDTDGDLASEFMIKLSGLINVTAGDFVL